mmetsp:Transcript_141190/g.199973  ORF Transcript_141190/g.199973 Transcript_141190/m.199973 type:complete len:83 (+) Transcript_141190:935-1183(+)
MHQRAWEQRTLLPKLRNRSMTFKPTSFARSALLPEKTKAHTPFQVCRGMQLTGSSPLSNKYSLEIMFSLKTQKSKGRHFAVN